jgi:hypothetical protein
MILLRGGRCCELNNFCDRHLTKLLEESVERLSEDLLVVTVFALDEASKAQ